LAKRAPITLKSSLLPYYTQVAPLRQEKPIKNSKEKDEKEIYHRLFYYTPETTPKTTHPSCHVIRFQNERWREEKKQGIQNGNRSRGIEEDQQKGKTKIEEEE
jgi:hypothetical protein